MKYMTHKIIIIVVVVITKDKGSKQLERDVISCHVMQLFPLEK